MGFTEHRYRSYDGLSLYYREYGAGDDVAICLPGLTRNCKDFEDLAEHLAGNSKRAWRVLTPDLRGRGRSDRDPKSANYHPGTYVRDTWTLLDGLGVDRVALIGTSLGGLMSMIMADQQPLRLRGVVLNDVGPELPPEAVGRILQYAGRTPPASDWAAAAAAAKQNYRLAFPDAPDSFWDRYVRLSWVENAEGRPAPDMDPAIGEALRGTRDAAPIDTWAAFRALRMPCLLLRGALSDVLTEDIVARMQQAKRDLQVVYVPDRGHTPLLDEPAARAAIDDFLTTVP